MYRVMCAAIVAAMMFTGASATAGTADRAASIAPHVGAPMTLLGVRVRIYNSANGVANYAFNLCAAYTETNVRAIRYRVTAIDAFGGAIAAATIDDKGDPPAPSFGRLIIANDGIGPYLDPPFARCIAIVNPFPANAERFVVGLDAVALADGTVWRSASAR